MEHKPTLESTTRDILEALNRLNQLVEETRRNELEIREFMLRNNADMKSELDRLELNHRKAMEACKSAAVYLN